MRFAHLIVAAVDLEVGRKRSATNEEEQGIECIRCEHKEWRDGKGLVDCAGDEVEQRQHSEDGDKHDIVDDGWIAAFGIGNHVTDQRHDEESPEKLLEAI